LAILLILILVQYTPSQNNSKDARQLVNNSINAMGGAEKLNAIKLIHTKSVGHIYFLEQSERPNGPWYVDYQKTEEWRDVEHGNVRRTFEQTGIQEGNGTDIVANGVSASLNGTSFVPNPGNVQPIEENLATAPERVLLNALAASDLKYEGTEVIQDVPHAVVSFTWKNSPVKLYLNRNTNLLTMTDVVRARPTELFWSIWGDFSEKNYYSYWNLQKGGLRYPQQVDAFYNGQPLSTNTILSIEFNPEVPKDTFLIPDDVIAKYASIPKTSFADMPLGRSDRPPVDLAPGFTVIRGSWNVTLVKQDDGIVIIEAPISSSYSAKALDEVKKRFPDQKIKCVISTSDSFPHFGGLREYVARGIPVYILDLNKPIVDRLIAATYKTYPDSLEKNLERKKSKLNIVSGKTVIGAGANQLELYPIRSETGERMIMIYAPQLKVLYGSDLVQLLPTGSFFMPEYLSELKNAADREKLDVEHVFAIHGSPIEWKKVLDALNDSEK
jgi:hypothetical protein